MCTNRVLCCEDESAQLGHTIEHHCQPEEVQEAGGVDANTPLVVGDHPGQDLQVGAYVYTYHACNAAGVRRYQGKTEESWGHVLEYCRVEL